MKKTFLLLIALAFGFTSFAQKPSEGNLLTEANFSISNWDNSFSLPALRFRYFLADDMVLRGDVSLMGGKQTNNYSENADGTGSTGSQEIKSSGLGIAAGIEKHWGGNAKFSPFAGASLGFMTYSDDETWTDSDGSSYVKGLSAEVETGGSMISLTLSLGADYWVTESFYLGAELGWGLASDNEKDGTVSVTSGGSTSTSTSLGGSNFGYGEGMAPGFRIGFILN